MDVNTQRRKYRQLKIRPLLDSEDDLNCSSCQNKLVNGRVFVASSGMRIGKMGMIRIIGVWDKLIKQILVD